MRNGFAFSFFRTEEKSINERCDNLKLMIAELRLERCKKAYRASKKRLEKTEN